MIKYIFSALLVLAVIVAAIIMPRTLSFYRDKNTQGIIYTEPLKSLEGGYQYELSTTDRLFIFSKFQPYHLQAQRENMLPASIQPVPQKNNYVMTLVDTDSQPDHLLDEISILKDLGILPDVSFEDSGFIQNLYSLNSMYTPSILVWECGSDGSQLIDWRIYMDAQTNKIYSFYVDTTLEWESINTDLIVMAWCKYMDAAEAVQLPSSDEMLENTPYHKKYVLNGENDDRIILTIGLYPGSQTLFFRTDGITPTH